MKWNFALAISFVLIAVIGCSQLRQRSQNSSPGSSPPTQSSPAVAEPVPKRSKGERATPDEAKAMLAQAITHYNSVGRKQALADFTGRKSPFYDRDLYVACIGPDHLIAANGGYPSVVGSSADAWKDAEGRSVGKAAFDAIAGTGEGAVRYRWTNPVSGKIEPKVLFVQKVGDDVCGVGAYNPD